MPSRCQVWPQLRRASAGVAAPWPARPTRPRLVGGETCSVVRAFWRQSLCWGLGCAGSSGGAAASLCAWGWQGTVGPTCSLRPGAGASWSQAAHVLQATRPHDSFGSHLGTSWLWQWRHSGQGQGCATCPAVHQTPPPPIITPEPRPLVQMSLRWPCQGSSRACPASCPEGLNPSSLSLPLLGGVCPAPAACGLDAFGPQPRTPEAVLGFIFISAALPSSLWSLHPAPRLWEVQPLLPVVSPVLTLGVPRACRGG